MSRWSPRDERRHDPGPLESWEESFDFDFAAPDGTLGGFVRMAFRPYESRSWCWVYVLDADGTVVVRDHDAPLPERRALLVRSEGLWCELVCETPFEHWSIGVEAFGVRLDDARDGLRGEIGTRLPVGLEVEWEIAPGDAAPRLTPSGYEQSGTVRGDVLLGKDVIALDGIGVRRHEWGARDWRSARRRLSCAAGAPVGAVPLLRAYVPLPERDGRDAYLERSLAWCTLDDGREAPGWLDTVQVAEPPPED